MLWSSARPVLQILVGDFLFVWVVSVLGVREGRREGRGFWGFLWGFVFIGGFVLFFVCFLGFCLFVLWIFGGVFCLVFGVFFVC